MRTKVEFKMLLRLLKSLRSIFSFYSAHLKGSIPLFSAEICRFTVNEMFAILVRIGSVQFSACGC